MPLVLVVEDDVVVRSVLTRFLEREGHEVQFAGTGREALEKLAAATFDLIFTDIHMPDMDGIELILAVRETGHPVPIVAVSGGGLRADAESLLTDAGQLGAVEVIPKPFNLGQIRAVLSRHLSPLLSVLALFV